jgi:hypothetical protein
MHGENASQSHLRDHPHLLLHCGSMWTGSINEATGSVGDGKKRSRRDHGDRFMVLLCSLYTIPAVPRPFHRPVVARQPVGVIGQAIVLTTASVPSGRLDNTADQSSKGGSLRNLLRNMGLATRPTVSRGQETERGTRQLLVIVFSCPSGIDTVRPVTMSDRLRKELEEKRARLIELRRAKDERRALLAQSEKAQAEVRVIHYKGRGGWGWSTCQNQLTI